MKYLLFPFAIIYGIIIYIRNFLYDSQILKTFKFENVKTINIGNLSIGGTGKTPHTEYIIQLLKKNYKLATLSRGYGRKSVAYQYATENSTAKDIGDEPLLFYKKNNDINVNVCNDRIDGVINIMSIFPETEIILLDDAFQHRKINAGLNILITTYSNPFYKDLFIPIGTLRDSKMQYKRADIIIISKCPEHVNDSSKKQFIEKIKLRKNQILLFTKIIYKDLYDIKRKIYIKIDDISKNSNLLLTSIASPQLIIEYLNKNNIKYKSLKYRDHYNFQKADLEKIIEENKKFENIIITYKDYMRLINFVEIFENYNVFILDIEVDFVNTEDKTIFYNKIKDYVE